jgi:hypothetical protein
MTTATARLVDVDVFSHSGLVTLRGHPPRRLLLCRQATHSAPDGFWRTETGLNFHATTGAHMDGQGRALKGSRFCLEVASVKQVESYFPRSL